MKRLATVSITVEAVCFVLRDVTGELFSCTFQRSKYLSVLDVLRDVARPRGAVDYTFINADWQSMPDGMDIRGLGWPYFKPEAVRAGVSGKVELTTREPDAVMAMLRIVQDELNAAVRGTVLS